MVSQRRNGGTGRGRISEKQQNGEENDEESLGEYEASRALRIKQNFERMKSLGILDLSKKLNSKPPSKPRPKPTPRPSDHPPRRSSRLKDVPRPSYSEKHIPKMEKPRMEVRIPAGENPEIYTEQDEKLLGDSNTAWVLNVDGFDEEGQRIYDPIQGKSCHQCRQKTIGLRTECSNCKAGTGHFCGDCLYMRYGENVVEVNQNLTWVCPVCRGICNCSRCRREKGWVPTAAIYKKVVQLGFKSVAHYLIHTYRGQATDNVAASENPVSVCDGNEKSEGAAGNVEETKEDLELESDQDYEGDTSQDDGDDVDGEYSSS